MNSAKTLFVVGVVGIICGCTPAQRSALDPGKTLLTVDFQQGQTLKYKFVSSRDIAIDWGQVRGTAGDRNKIDRYSESLTLIVSYIPVEVDPYGLTKIKATCESVSVNRTGESPHRSSRPDAAKTFAGKMWTFTVEPTGKMEDRSELYDVIRQAGQQAFRPDRSRGLIKEPDMIYDFIASQWFLWDSVSSIKKPIEGILAGDQWQSKLFVPAPMILFAARDVNYRLEEIRQDAGGRVAVIGSYYSLLWPNPSDWPVPYTEIFQMSGTFGFLRGYKVLDLQGQGQELFNIDAGRTDRYTQNYTMHVQASMLLPGVHPQITIEQTLTMELISPTTASEEGR